MIRIGIQSTTKVIFAAVFVFAEAANAAPQTLTSIDGTKLLPDHMISLFYDDGPDVHTLAPTGTVLNVANQNYLANYLNSQRVSVTFNVVGAFPPFSSPHLPPTAAADGSGYLNYSLNYPNSFLSSIIKLGHRLGNHTLNHVPLASGFANDQTRLYSAASAPWFNPISDLDAKSFDGIKYQVLKQFTYLSPYISNGLYTLTPPGGLWDANSDGPLVGDYPVLLRIDPENSYKVGSKKLFMTPLSYCGNAPATSGTYDVSVNASDWCYARLQLPASQYAQDLIDSISAYTAANANGFYLFNHDRNEGAVGSTYALDVAKIVIPYLKQNGYVFVGPIINFSKIVSSAPFPDSEGWIADSAYYQTFRSADIDGDGHADVCARGGAGIFCSLSTTVAPNGLGSNPVVQFGNEQLWETTQFTDANGWNDARYAMTIMLADVNGDGKADLIARNAAGILVATSNGQGFNSPQMWLSATLISILRPATQFG